MFPLRPPGLGKKPLFYLMGPVGGDDNFHTSFAGTELRNNKRQKEQKKQKTKHYV